MRHLVQNICKLRSRVSPQTTGDRAAAKGGWAGRLQGSGRPAWGFLGSALAQSFRASSFPCPKFMFYSNVAKIQNVSSWLGRGQGIR
jgi:hypothetical protein